MTDADTVREALQKYPLAEQVHAARAALDRLVAERDEAREAGYYFKDQREAIARRAEAAEAERDRLRETLELTRPWVVTHTVAPDAHLIRVEAAMEVLSAIDDALGGHQ